MQIDADPDLGPAYHFDAEDKTCLQELLNVLLFHFVQYLEN